MADKTINELQLIAGVTDSLSIPSDNGTQTYRFTAAQMLAYILAAGNVSLASLNTSIFNGLTAVTSAEDDFLVTVDTSDSNKTKKILASSFSRNSYRSVTTYPDSVLSTDGSLKLSGTSGTITLPTAVGIAGKRVKFIHSGTSLTQVYTLATTGGQTIGGVAGGSYALYTNGEVLEIESDGANWVILNHYAQTDWIDGGVHVITATTTSPTKPSGVTVDKMYWKREGRFARIQTALRFSNNTSGANGAGDYIFALPTGLTMDTTYTGTYVTAEGYGGAFDLNNTYRIGDCNTAYNGGESGMIGGCVAYDSTKFRAWSQNWTNYGFFGSAFTIFSSAAPFNLNFNLFVPISGWRP